jgi:hypothetical protein
MNDHDGVQNAALSDVRQVDTPNVDERGTGYKRPPAKNRFRKGQSGNPFGRRKGQRNMPAILNDVLAQTVTVKQGTKSERMTKGEAAIKMIMSKAQNGDRRAIDAVAFLAEKIGRLEDVNSATSLRGGIMLVPGVAKSSEEWNILMAAHRKKTAEKDEQRKADAPRLEREEASLRNTIALHRGTPLADEAAIHLKELTHSIEYLSNFYIKMNPAPSADPLKDTAVAAPEERIAKLPWDQQEFIRMPFCKRDEYIRTHSESSEA